MPAPATKASRSPAASAPGYSHNNSPGLPGPGTWAWPALGRRILRSSTVTTSGSRTRWPSALPPRVTGRSRPYRWAGSGTSWNRAVRFLVRSSRICSRQNTSRRSRGRWSFRSRSSNGSAPSIPSYVLAQDVDWVSRAMTAGSRRSLVDRLVLIKRIHGENVSLRANESARAASPAAPQNLIRAPLFNSFVR